MRHQWSTQEFRTAFIATSIGWAALLPLTSWAASRAHAPSIVYVGAMVVYGAGALICHQLPTRSFHMWTVQMPVCARCAGMYAGAAIASMMAMAAAWRGVRRATRLAFLVAAAPTAVTLVYEWWSGQTPANWIRAAAGVPIGAAVTAVVVAATGDQVN